MTLGSFVEPQLFQKVDISGVLGRHPFRVGRLGGSDIHEWAFYRDRCWVSVKRIVQTSRQHEEGDA